MARISLKQIVGAQNGLRPVVAAFERALGGVVAVEDATGGALLGTADGGDRHAVVHDGKDLGWVSGPQGAEAVAGLLQFLADKESERKALGSEVLHLYREVNLIYSFSEKIAALLEVDGVARLTLQEARHLIVATDGALLLLDDETGALTTIAGFGDELPSLDGFRRG